VKCHPERFLILTLLFPQIIKLKAEARLDLLKQIGVSVDTWLKSAMNQVMEELENERWASLPSVTNNGSAHLVWPHPFPVLKGSF